MIIIPDMTLAQQRIADAAIHVIVSRGFDVVSMRTVAEASGITAGTVQYHFRTRDDLLRGAFLRSMQRQISIISAIDKDVPPRDYVTGCLLPLLPTGGDYAEDAVAWVAFAAASRTRPWLAELFDEALVRLRRFLADYLREAERTGKVKLAFSPEQSARLISAILDGLTLDAINAPADTWHIVEQDLRDGIHLVIREKTQNR